MVNEGEPGNPGRAEPHVGGVPQEEQGFLWTGSALSCGLRVASVVLWWEWGSACSPGCRWDRTQGSCSPLTAPQLVHWNLQEADKSVGRLEGRAGTLGPGC